MVTKFKKIFASLSRNQPIIIISTLNKVHTIEVLKAKKE
jgi:hypothetical protein